jgi:drug/metabolite transporter (DMT)-like permease
MPDLVWTAFIASHLAASVVTALLLRRSQLEGIDGWTMATAMQTGMTITVWVAAIFWWHPTAGMYDWRTCGFIVMAVVFVVALHYANVKTLQHLEASVYAVYYNLRIPITTFLGIVFLHEDVHVWQIAGGLCLLAAVFVVQQTRDPFTRIGAAWGVFTGLAVSGSTFAEKAVLTELENDPGIAFMNYAMPGMTLAALLMWTVLMRRSKPLQLGHFRQRRVLQVAAARTISAHGFTLALATGGTLSVTNYISSLSVVLIVLFGIRRLGENDALSSKLTSVAFALTGITLIFLSSLIQ